MIFRLILKQIGGKLVRIAERYIELVLVVEGLLQRELNLEELQVLKNIIAKEIESKERFPNEVITEILLNQNLEVI
jgi:hypothetical protein